MLKEFIARFSFLLFSRNFCTYFIKKLVWNFLCQTLVLFFFLFWNWGYISLVEWVWSVPPFYFARKVWEYNLFLEKPEEFSSGEDLCLCLLRARGHCPRVLGAQHGLPAAVLKHYSNLRPAPLSSLFTAHSKVSALASACSFWSWRLPKTLNSLLCTQGKNTHL